MSREIKVCVLEREQIRQRPLVWPPLHPFLVVFRWWFSLDSHPPVYVGLEGLAEASKKLNVDMFIFTTGIKKIEKKVEST